MTKQELIRFLLSEAKQNRVLLSTVSGAASTKPELIQYFSDDVPAVSIITTKSFQVIKNDGNPEPIICESSVGTFGNSVGLRNPGMDVALPQLQKLRDKNAIHKILNVSLSASNPDDFITLLKAFEPVADICELNFSCPHAASGYGASIGCSLEIASSYVKKIRAALPQYSVPIFVKLTPNVSNIGEIAAACVKAGADGIVAINTVGPELYLEPHSRQPILNNKIGGKGGKSGAEIFQTALAAIKDIKAAVGENVPIIGMGGVVTGYDAAQLIQAGAHAVGIGSALARVPQQKWPDYFEAVKSEAENLLTGETKTKNLKSAADYVSAKPRMQYIPKTVTKMEPYGCDVMIMQLEGEMEYSAGQFVFLWLPGIGEKPFSIALSKPLTFMIKKRGAVTDALCKLSAGDTVYVRGLYGDAVHIVPEKKAILIAGGTGIAVLPKLAEHLHRSGIAVETFVGTVEMFDKPVSDVPTNILETALLQYGDYTRVADEGTPGRVLQIVKEQLQNTDRTELTCYIVGPTIFFTKAAEMLNELGIPDTAIFLSLEKLTRCGVGLCGECVCGKKLTCQHGTFVRYDEYKAANGMSLS